MTFLSSLLLALSVQEGPSLWQVGTQAYELWYSAACISLVVLCLTLWSFHPMSVQLSIQQKCLDFWSSFSFLLLKFQLSQPLWSLIFLYLILCQGLFFKFTYNTGFRYIVIQQLMYITKCSSGKCSYHLSSYKDIIILIVPVLYFYPCDWMT